MQSKTKILKNLISKTLSIAFLLLTFVGYTQEGELIIDEASNIDFQEREKEPKSTDTTTAFKRFKVDGVVAVMGDHVILDSDIDYMYVQLQSQSISISDVSRCQLLGKLMEDKLYEHQAVQDSLMVSDTEINAQIDQQIAYLLSELGSEERLLRFYRKDNMLEFRKEFYNITKSNRLASMMSEKIVADVSITPEEVRQYFFKIPEEDRPIFGAELEVAQIVIEPEITEKARKDVIDQLNEFRRDIIENDASFASKAVLYSQDPGSNTKGGVYTIEKKTPFIKEFKDMAFSLQEGEISEPFESEFGFHLLKVDKIRGQTLDVRHILLIPQVEQETINEARNKIDIIRQKIIDGEISFSEAAKSESDEKETRNNGGQLVNPLTGDTRFDLTKMEPLMSTQVYHLKNGEISNIFTDESRGGRRSYKILKVTNRIEEHVADFSLDYVKIKELALMQKRIDAVEKWQKEKISETYIHINKDYQDCDFIHNWQKK